MASNYIRIRVRKSKLNPEDPYRKILHEHLRYAGLIEIEESIAARGKDYEEKEYIEVKIPLRGTLIRVAHAKRMCERINSFGDEAEVIP